MKVVVFCAALAISACGPRYELVKSCYNQAGTEPGADFNAFGAVGAIIKLDQTGHHEWAQRVDACMLAGRVE